MRPSMVVHHAFTRFLVTGHVAVASAFVAPSPASAAPVAACVQPDLREELAACKRGRVISSGPRPQAPALRLPGASRVSKSGAEGAADAAPGYTLDPDARAGRESVKRRQRALLMRELALVRRLHARGKPGDPAGARVALRLARLSFELAREHDFAGRALDGAIAEACRGGGARGSRCKRLRAKQRAIFHERDEARASNVRALAGLLRDHPGHAREDYALFSLGLALEEMGQLDRARQVYHRLIREHPESQHVPRAYLAFAEHYFRHGDMGAARRFYEKVTEFPPERNPVHGYALYRQAWCRYNLDDFAGALRLLVETVELARARPEDRQLTPLLVQARKEMVLPYAQVGDAKKALRFFERYAADAEQARETYERLGELYFDLGRWPDARAVYHGLMAEAPDSPLLCTWQQRVTETILASGNKAAQAAEVRRLIDLYETRKERGPEEVARCRDAAAGTAIELAVAWHREAVGTDTQPGTRDRGTMSLAADLYDRVLDAFDSFDGIAFARIDPRDRPTRYSLSYYRAELAWQMGRHEACGPAFDRVLEIDPDGPLTEDAAYGAVLCYERLYRERYRPIDGKTLDAAGAAAALEPRELTSLERAMLGAFERYLCHVPEGEEALRIQYRRARIYYEANHFAEAAELFRQVAFDRAGDELSPIAANLYLDSLNVLSVTQPEHRAACYAAMEQALTPLSELHCGGGAGGSVLCKAVDTLRCQLLRKRAEGQQAEGRYRDAAATYVQIARRHRACEGRDEVLYNAALNFEAVRLLGRAIKVRKVLIDEHPDSEWAGRARYLLGSNFHALAFYDRAAEHYEDFARRYPRMGRDGCTEPERRADLCPDAVAALSNAIFFRLGLGDEEAAAADAELFERNYRRQDPRAASRVRFALGSVYVQRDDHERVVRHYRGFVRDYGRHALPHELLRAHLEIGRSLTAAGDHAGAARAFAAVLDTYDDAASRIESQEGVDAAEKARFAALARIAAAEAAFNRGEDERRSFEAVAFPKPRIRGATSAARGAAFKRWLDGDFQAWIRDKGGALVRAREVYEAVDSLKAPPWSIAAAARVGDMYLAFVDAFREAPVPPELERDEELRSIYWQSLDAASEPWVEQAQAAYRFCLETATRVRWFNDRLTHCEQKLFELDPRSYPRAAELRMRVPLTHTATAVPALVALGDATPAEEVVQ